MTPIIHFHPIVSQPFDENSYIVWRDDRSDCLVVDPGLEPDLIVEFLTDKKLSPAVLLCTHGHADHIGGNADLKRLFPDAPIVIGENEKHLLTDPVANLSAPFGMPILSPPADQTVRAGETVSFAGIDLRVREIPGHSPGHVVYIIDGAPNRVLGRGRPLRRQYRPHRLSRRQLRVARSGHPSRFVYFAGRYENLPRPRPDDHGRRRKTLEPICATVNRSAREGQAYSLAQDDGQANTLVPTTDGFVLVGDT